VRGAREEEEASPGPSKGGEVREEAGTAGRRDKEV